MVAVAYLPTAFALQAPSWIFFRSMDFVRVRALQSIVPVLTFCVTVPLAAAGVGVWSLVIGPAVGNTVAVLVAIRVSPYRLSLRFDADARARYFRFSWPVFVFALAVLIVGQGQVLAFTLHGGIIAAGYITLAVTLTRYAGPRRSDHRHHDLPGDVRRTRSHRHAARDVPVLQSRSR